MAQKTYACPKCGREVEAKDINVSTDIMLCPSCGEVSSFSEVVERLKSVRREDDVRRSLNASPPKGLKMETDAAGLSGRIVLTYRKFNPAVFFFVPFTCFWAGLSLVGIYGPQIAKCAFDLKDSLFGLPFLIGSVVLISVCLFMLFGKRVLTLERGRGAYFWGVGPLGFRRRFTYDRRTEVAQGMIFDNWQQNGNWRLELHLTHPDCADKIHICAGFSEDALAYTEAILRRELKKT